MVDADEVENLNEKIDEEEEKDEDVEDEELDELEQRLIPEEGKVNDAMTEVKHKLEIS